MMESPEICQMASRLAFFGNWIAVVSWGSHETSSSLEVYSQGLSVGIRVRNHGWDGMCGSFFFSLTVAVHCTYTVYTHVHTCTCTCIVCTLTCFWWYVLDWLLFPFFFLFRYFIFTSFWQYKIYYVFGFMLLVFLIMMIVTICVTIVCIYFLLNSEDYRWLAKKKSSTSTLF